MRARSQHGSGIAGSGGALIPFGSLAIVALDPHRVGIKFPQHGHRLRIALFLRASVSELERSLVLAALVRAEYEINIGIIGDGE